MNLLLCLMLKHFICDFPLQMTPWMYRNKGTYGHPGGVVHAGIHTIGAALVLLLLAPAFWWLALVDGVIHYHIDWAKVRLSTLWGLKPDNSEWFWVLLGADQLLHFLTYYLMAVVVAY